MRLLACPSCHTQYDVTEVALPEVTCRCGETLANRDPQAVDATIRRCSGCGASVGAQAESCSFCGSDIERDPGKLSLICPECYARCEEQARFCTACGVGFHPEPVVANGRELPCPACDALMPVHQVAGIAINECRTCHGLWAPDEHFEQLVKRALEARRDGATLVAAPRVSGANPAAQRVQYRRCPECMAFMQRRNYRKSSGVIVDVCFDHGTWLDSDELERIAGFLAKGGETSPTILAEERSTEQRRAELAAARLMARRSGGFRADADGSSVVGSLLDAFTRLLS